MVVPLPVLADIFRQSVQFFVRTPWEQRCKRVQPITEHALCFGLALALDPPLLVLRNVFAIA